ncbi:MAG: hypothetical protein FWG38_09955 [Defluviitaleaceae bacterium]|nr:hypothetical protein [Defluviitaleaceae bacterium]
MVKKAVSLEGLLFIVCFCAFFAVLGFFMGGTNMLNTIVNTAYALLMDTVFYIMAVAIIAGAISELFMEFGVVSIANKLLSKAVQVVYGMPGASVVGIFTTYLSDNPAILTLADNEGYRAYFKKYQIPALTNLGTSFGMGLILTAFIAGIVSPEGHNFFLPLIIGTLGSLVGSIVSVRLMLRYTAKKYGTTEEAVQDSGTQFDIINYRTTREGPPLQRLMEALLGGGHRGVKLGLSIAPGVLIICTVILLLTNGMPTYGYTGGAFEGVGFIPALGEWFGFIIRPLFGFTDTAALAVPLTALGSAGASMGLIPVLVNEGVIVRRDVAVIVGMIMCWSGFMSTHLAMMDSLGFPKLAGRSILYHTIAGVCAGVSANFIYRLIEWVF